MSLDIFLSSADMKYSTAHAFVTFDTEESAAKAVVSEVRFKMNFSIHNMCLT